MVKVTVIINCFNGAKYLREAIDSIYAQTFSDWEIFFFDNNSSDESSEIAKSYSSKLKYYKHHQTIPLGHARKLAVEMTTKQSEWIAFLDTDDIWLPNKLERQMQELSKSKEFNFGLCYAGIEEVYENKKHIRNFTPTYSSGWLLDKLLNQFDINMVTPLLKRSILSEFNLNFDENITASEEYNLFVRISAKSPICVIPEVLGIYRVSTKSLTDKQMSKWAYERNYTLDQLISENPDIDKKYSNSFTEARARANYYEARYLMSIGSTVEAKKKMLKIKRINYKYQILWLCTYFPIFWTIVHKNFLKRSLLPKLLGLFR